MSYHSNIRRAVGVHARERAPFLGKFPQSLWHNGSNGGALGLPGAEPSRPFQQLAALLRPFREEKHEETE